MHRKRFEILLRDRLRTWALAGVGACLFASGLLLPATSDAYLYWANGWDFRTEEGTTISRTTTEGEDFVPDLTSGYRDPRGVAVDLDGTHLYWSAGGPNVFPVEPVQPAAIGRATVDGSSSDQSWVEAEDCTNSSDLRSPYNLAIDSTHVYWIDWTSEKIGRASFDGTGPNSGVECDWLDLTPFSPGYASFFGVAVDEEFVYWTQSMIENEDPPVFEPGRIGRVAKDGDADPDPNFLAPEDTRAIGRARAVAVNSAHLYWLGNSDSTRPGRVGRASIDGTGIEPSFFTPASVGDGIALDDRFIYFSNYYSPIARVRQDGSGTPETVLPSSTDRRLGIFVTWVSGDFAPVSRDFGEVEVDPESTQSRVFSLNSSGGNVPFRIPAGGIAVSGPDGADFTIEGGTCVAGTTVLADGETCTVEVAFTPTSVGPKSAELQVDVVGGPIKASLTGTGIEPAGSLSPAGHDFGEREVGSVPPVTHSFTLTSTGDAPLTIDPDGIALTGTDPGEFTLVDGTGLDSCQAGNTSLANSETCTVEVAFEPGSTGAKAATLEVATNAELFSASLSGTGVRTPVPGPSFTALKLTSKFKRVKAPRKGTRKVWVTVRVRNSGDAAGTATVKLRSSSRKVKVPRQVRVTVGANASAIGRFKVTIPARAPRKAKITASVAGGGRPTVSNLSFSIVRPSK